MRIVYIDCFYGFSQEALLGALADCGAKKEDIQKSIENKGATLNFKKEERMSLECTRVQIFAEDREGVMHLAVESALKSLDADYVMCSPVPLCDSADGEIITLFQESGIECVCTNEDMVMSKDDAQALCSVVNECGAKPEMDIISVGYGADGGEYFLCVTIGEYHEESLLFKDYEAKEFV